MTRFFYATGFKTYEAAEFALIDMFADGEVSLSEHPLVESYTAKNGKRRFAVTLNAE
jgi:hypothetical protein